MYYKIIPANSVGPILHVVDYDDNLQELQNRTQAYCSGQDVSLHHYTYVSSGSVTCAENGSQLYTHIIEVSLPNLSAIQRIV